ncbi:helix-turn-helix domain-containing protein [Streptomyces inhibens]|uniref:helix-turn-helix domain-containing protein n=1 Tax=Streptomyces inhibens TaxID=2293571 RepID=UPI00402AB5C2
MSGSGGEPCEGVESSRLAASMRELRGRTGLSLAALAARTPYSKSSWERYLNGKKLPPRDAVEALCRLAGEPAGRLVALWELADAAWSGRGRSGAAREDTAREDTAREGAGSGASGAVGSGSTSPEEASVDTARRRIPRWVVPVAAGACVGLVAVGAVLTFWTGERAYEGGPAERAVPTSPAVTGCRRMSCDGKDPQSMFCGVEGLVETLVERIAAGGERVQVRYAKACGAVWGRIGNGRIGDRIEVSVPGVKPRSVKVVDRFDAEGYLVTPMAAARGSQGIRLCLYPAGGGAKECFAR